MHLSTKKRLRIVTRKSPLALWQTAYVKKHLLSLMPELKVEILAMQTAGDLRLNTSAVLGGGKDLFVKELETALLDGSAELAVHSMKDVAVDLPAGLIIPAVLKRADPRDALISNRYNSLFALPMQATVGTSSLRRRAQLCTLRPDLNIVDLHGNIGTRLDKLARGQYDAIILAAAGMERLGLTQRITQLLGCDLLLPAIGQGAIAIECHADTWVQDIVEQLNDTISMYCIRAERAFSRRLGGGCQLPIAAYAQCIEQTIKISGWVGRVDGSAAISKVMQGRVADVEQLGKELAEQLLANGADKILGELGL